MQHAVSCGTSLTHVFCSLSRPPCSRQRRSVFCSPARSACVGRYVCFIRRKTFRSDVPEQLLRQRPKQHCLQSRCKLAACLPIEMQCYTESRWGLNACRKSLAHAVFTLSHSAGHDAAESTSNSQNPPPASPRLNKTASTGACMCI